MKFFVITGMSGAGKSSAIKIMEDLGYYCVDNLPPALLAPFAELCVNSSGKLENIALVVDLRSGDMFSQLIDSLGELNKIGIEYEILFLDSSDSMLIKRYKESRRSHPLADGGMLLSGIQRERELLLEMRKLAKYLIDTTNLKSSQLRDEIHKICLDGKKFKGIVINILSFGFKYGIPPDVDLLFDVRFLPNPYYIEELKNKTGLDREVSDYVKGFSQTSEFVKKLNDMIEFLIPHYIEEGKHQLIIAIGCTGGKHRSITIAEELKNFLMQTDYQITINHRDELKN